MLLSKSMSLLKWCIKIYARIGNVYFSFLPFNLTNSHIEKLIKRIKEKSKGAKLVVSTIMRLKPLLANSLHKREQNDFILDERRPIKTKKFRISVN